MKTRRLFSGILFKFSGGAVTWTSRRQQSVSLSTTEAEYVAASEASKDAIWLAHVYNEIVPLNAVPVLLVDNASAISLMKNPQYHKRTKHINVRYHFMRERVENHELLVNMW